MDGELHQDAIGDQALCAWLRLNRLHGFGPKTIHKLLSIYADPEQIFNASQAELKHSGLSTTLITRIQAADDQGLEEDLAWLESHSHHHILTLHDTAYPTMLKDLQDAPPILYVNGDPAILKQAQLAIVGSRSATAGGLQIAREFAHNLVEAGLVITSGLALGIDAAAHQGALQAKGKTIAVLGTGPDRIYPARHLELAEQIVNSGVILSEFIPGTTPRKENFPRRNRLISGLSLGTLIVEAAPGSGSLITARFAMEQGKEVFAIPGSIHNPQARACHSLIRDGATLVDCVEQVIEDLGPLYTALITQQVESEALNKRVTSVSDQDSSSSLEPEQKLLLENIAYDAISVDQMVVRTGLTASDVSAILLTLELNGHVISQSGGMYVKSS